MSGPWGRSGEVSAGGITMRGHVPGACWCGETHDDEPSDGTVPPAPEPVAGLREALSDAVKRAGVYEVADALVFAFLDGTFADATEEQVRHAVYEAVGRAALLDTDRPGLDVGFAAIVEQYLRLDDALPDTKPDTMPTGVWDARLREVANARAGVDHYLRAARLQEKPDDE